MLRCCVVEWGVERASGAKSSTSRSSGTSLARKPDKTNHTSERVARLSGYRSCRETQSYLKPLNRFSTRVSCLCLFLRAAGLPSSLPGTAFHRCVGVRAGSGATHASYRDDQELSTGPEHQEHSKQLCKTGETIGGSTPDGGNPCFDFYFYLIS